MTSIPARVFMKLMRVLPHPGATGLAAARAARRNASLMTLPPPRNTWTRDACAPSFRGEWHHGPNVHPTARVVYFHGGGYVSGSPRTHRYFTATLAKLSGLPILSVDYRRAPEDPFPAALDDAVAAIRWARDHDAVGPSPATRLFVGGDSAGGGLALAAMLRLRELGEPLPDGALLLSPWTDLTLSGPTVQQRRADDPMLDYDQGAAWADMYRGDEPADSPLVSPLFADLAGLPPLYVLVGGREILYDDSVRLVARGRAAGVEVHLDYEPDMFHIWPVFVALLPEARSATDRMAWWLAEQTRKPA